MKKVSRFGGLLSFGLIWAFGCASGVPGSDEERSDPALEKDFLSGFSVNAKKGWDIYPGGGYRYGPSIILSPGNVTEMWLAAPPDETVMGPPFVDEQGVHFPSADSVRYRRSEDEGRSWDEITALIPEPHGFDTVSTCDPGVIRIGEWYYIGYTTTLQGGQWIDKNGNEQPDELLGEYLNSPIWIDSNHNGIREDTELIKIGGFYNHICVARSKYSNGPWDKWEKWNGSGWGGDPAPVISPDAVTKPYEWGVGEPSFVLVGDTLYIYYNYGGGGKGEIRLVTVDATDENWPAQITKDMIANAVTSIVHTEGEASVDIKYVEEKSLFIAVAEKSRLSPDSSIVFHLSEDGRTFREAARVKTNIEKFAHNSGISGREDGHLSLCDKNFIAYAYADVKNDCPPDPAHPEDNCWGNWHTRLNPIFLWGHDGTEYNPPYTQHYCNDFRTQWIAHTPSALHPTFAQGGWRFLIGDYDRDGKLDVYGISTQATGSGKVEVHVLNGADGFQTFLLHTASGLVTAGADSLEYALGDYNGDGLLDMYTFLRQGASGTTEIHILDGADQFSSYLLHSTTCLHPTDQNFTFRLGNYNDDRYPDVYAIKRSGTSGRTEVHVLDGKGFGRFLLQTATFRSSTADTSRYDFAVADFNGDQISDLVVFDRQGKLNTTEIEVLDGASGFRSFQYRLPTVLGPTDQNYSLAMADYDVGGAPEVWVIQKNGASGTTEIHILEPIRARDPNINPEPNPLRPGPPHIP